ncbi:CBO0543 family protein [Bacillus rubiinfantis]|uniref:CBO0543 family protein n=1 Tax=Bacillus rubiinfantis TaxID=1499680 RepID=UPI000693F032|nr:CBO0543 family protein [Bacillus rubiinfantis]
MVIYQIAIATWSLIVSFWKGDWKNLAQYYPTLQYFVIGNLTYEYVAHFNFHLWKMDGKGLFPEIIADFILLFLIAVPAIFVYLSNYPNERRKKLQHILKWVLIFTAIEWISGKYFGIIKYEHGWSIWWSFLFNMIMFPMLRLHFISYKKALVLSIPCTLFYLLWFDYI